MYRFGRQFAGIFGKFGIGGTRIRSTATVDREHFDYYGYRARHNAFVAVAQPMRHVHCKHGGWPRYMIVAGAKLNVHGSVQPWFTEFALQYRCSGAIRETGVRPKVSQFVRLVAAEVHTRTRESNRIHDRVKDQISDALYSLLFIFFLRFPIFRNVCEVVPKILWHNEIINKLISLRVSSWIHRCRRYSHKNFAWLNFNQI